MQKNINSYDCCCFSDQWGGIYILYFAYLMIEKLFATLFFRKNIVIQGSLPMGGFVLAANHVGWLDIVFLGTAIWPRHVHFMAKKELFKNSFISLILNSLNAFPVNRANPGPSSLKIPINLLREGEIVGIFPSGTRSQENISLKKGAVTIAQLLDVPIVPVFYKGPSTISWKYLFKKRKVDIIIGRPIIEVDSNKSVNEKRALLMDSFQKSLIELEKEIKCGC